MLNNPTDVSGIETTLEGIIDDIVDVKAVVDETVILTASIDDSTSHFTAIFPSDTNLTCTFTAAAAPNTWSAWTEIVDSAATKFSDAFATEAGHITSILIETISDDGAIYMYEIAYSDAKTLITSGRFAGVGKFQAAHIQDRFWAPEFKAGELIYYRMKTETAVADTCTVHLRYHLHEEI